MIRVTDNAMTSDSGPHTAYRLDHWLVSWLPQRVLDREQALMAMTLADIYTGDPAEDSSWELIARDYAKALKLPRGFRPTWIRNTGQRPPAAGDER